MRIFTSCSRTGKLIVLVVSLLMTGCASIGARYEAADRIAAHGGFEKRFIRAGDFTLTAYCRFTKPFDDLTVYIEGDGAAWLSPAILSGDPTPRKPLVLELAAIDRAVNVAYLARPGQYTATAAPDCSPEYWSGRRFSPEVVAAFHTAIDRLRTDARSERISLVGYSGGAAVAVLIAAGRSDISTLRTVAGNLDTEAVNRYHGVSALAGSVNPIDAAEMIRDLPQHHFAGSRDTVVPVFIAESFLNRAGDQDKHRLTIIEGVSHTEGWHERWKSLLALPF